MGYKNDEQITITFKSLKDAQNEAFHDGIAFARSQIAYYLPPEAERDLILSFLNLIKNTDLYTVEESCECEEDCGADGCEGEESDCECLECKDLA